MTASNTATSFSRRSFIKGAAALSGAGLLVSCTPAENSGGNGGNDDGLASTGGNEEIFPVTCGCGEHCWMNAHIRDGQLVRTSAREMPDPAYSRICMRGLSQVGRVYSSERVLYPMKRVGERGSDDFERISWDEALEFIASKWKEITDQYGPGAMIMANGAGRYTLANGCTDVMGAHNRFKNVVGASGISTSLDVGLSFGAEHATGGTSCINEIADVKNAKTAILWGYNPAVSSPQGLHFFLEAKEQGTRFIVIDPVYNANAAKADWWVPIKAGTDGALAAAMLNIYFTRGLLDEKYLKSATNCPYLIKEDGAFLRMSDFGVEPTTEVDPVTGQETKNDPIVVWDTVAGKAVPIAEAADPQLEGVGEIDGMKVQTVWENARDAVSAYTPERSAEICGLKVEDVEELARVYIEEGPVYTGCFQGQNPYLNANYTGWLLWLVPILTGNVGKPGAGIGAYAWFLTQYMNFNYAVIMPTDAEGNPCQGADPRTYNTAYMKEIVETGKYNGQDATVKGIWFNFMNPLGTWADVENTKEWVSKLDLVITSEVKMSDTAKYSDIVLPAANWYEYSDIGCYVHMSHPYMIWTDKVIEPLGECKPDFEIYKAVAEKMGYGEFFDLTAEDYIRQALDTEGWKAMGVSLDELKEKKIIRIVPEGYVADTSAFGNENGRAYLYHEEVKRQYDAGQEIDPAKEQCLYWEEPKYAGEHSAARTGKYPFHILSTKIRTQSHTKWSECGYTREITPDPVAMFNPEDAAEYDIHEGDIVKLTNQTGYVVIKSAISASVPPLTIAVTRGWNTWDYIEGNFQGMMPQEFNQTSQNQAFADVACSVEKM